MTQAAQDAEPGAEPAVIGRYAVQGVLGRGAMGVIYRAHDPEIDRSVAIKLIRADLLEGDDRTDFIARFRQEAQAAARCAHPNIVAVYDFALHEGNPFLAMEFVDGATLSHMIAEARAQGGRIPVPHAVLVMRQVLAALDAAHGFGIVHRDVKPANIMLTKDGRVKVADFGISRLPNSSLTQAGAMVGTPSYMSPEQCRGDAVDARSDVFSAGVVLFELLSGEKPFRGNSALEVLNRLLNEAAPELAASVPEPLRAVVRRSLAKAPADRYASAAAMAAALAGAMAPGHGDADDFTIIGEASQSAALQGGAPAFDREVIDAVERKLAAYVGPIARHLVQSAARTSDSVEGLCASLAASIERPAERERFAHDVRSTIGGATSLAGNRSLAGLGAGVTDAEADAVQQELAHHVGPLARVLVKRARPGAASVAALRQALAAHIDDAAVREAFVRG